MQGARSITLIVVLSLLGCAGDDTDGESMAHTLGLEMMNELDLAVARQCSCLVEQEILYDSLDACSMALGQEPANSECVARVLEEHGTPEQLEAARCYLDHLRTTNACSEAASCEALVDGMCTSLAANLQCNDAVLSLLTFLLEHCPDLTMFA